MDLINLCDPIFQYVCFLRRHACNDTANITFEKSKKDLLRLLDEINDNLRKGSRLWCQYTRIHLSLLFFVDSMICTSKISFSEEWDKNRLAYTKRELTGDTKFFSELELFLDEYTLDADECLKFYYVCLGLGFRGELVKRPDKLEDYMHRIKHRISDVIIAEENVTFLTEEIKKTDKRCLISPILFTWQKSVIFVAVLFFLWLLANTTFFYKSTGKLYKNLGILNSSISNHKQG